MEEYGYNVNNGSAWVNDIPFEHYGAQLLSEYTYTPPEVTEETYKGRQRSSFTLLNATLGFGALNLPILFSGDSREDVPIKKSMFDAAIFGRAVLTMADGFIFDTVLEDFGEASYPGVGLLSCTYTFKAVRRKGLRKVVGNTIYCDSTAPHTDCVLSVKVGASASNYRVGSVIFPTVSAGQSLVVDGITKRILVDGAPAAQLAEWTKFPSLTPGVNAIQCLDTVTVEYYPIFF